MKAILFYQRKLSKKQCKYSPSCSQYTMESINNLGWFFGILVGAMRIIRCNPLSKGGYDPAPENPLLKKWVL